MVGLLLGIFYREFTKFNDFTGKTVLGGLHTHMITLGSVFLLVVLLLENAFSLTSHKKYDRFFKSYNIGLIEKSP